MTDGDRARMRDGSTAWLVDGNNVFGSRPDGWWNDRGAAMERFGQSVALWCRTHQDPVTVVFDRPVPDDVLTLGGGNLTVVAAERAGRNGADHTIVELAHEAIAIDLGLRVVVVSSDKGLRERLPVAVTALGAGRFRALIDY